MQTDAFEKAMSDRGLVKSSSDTRKSALLRIERLEGIDLDEEFERDGLVSLINRFTYSVDDERSNEPNPTKINVGKGSLRSVLAWYKSHLSQYRKFRLSDDPEVFEGIAASLSDDEDVSEDEPYGSATFRLESDLQTALRALITQLEPGLEVVDGGVERKVASGFIDILARDSNGAHVVIELKAGTAKDAVIAQTLGYMADIADETATNVRGIIVASDFRPRVESAARAIPNLELKSYSYRFEFT